MTKYNRVNKGYPDWYTMKDPLHRGHADDLQAESSGLVIGRLLTEVHLFSPRRTQFLLTNAEISQMIIYLFP